MKPRFFSELDTEFSALFQEGIPVLNYHMVENLPKDNQLKGLYISPRAFSHQLKHLTKAGYSWASLDGMVASRQREVKRLAITFDDAFVSVYENAMEPLREWGWKAIQFVVTDRLGRSNEWDLALGQKQLPIMSESQLKEWMAEGHQVGSHTLTHPYLTRIPIHEAKEEIFSSKKKLEDLIGVRVDHFCYPYGNYNPAVRDLVIEAGYQTASTVDFGVNLKSSDPWTLKRIKGRHRTRKLSNLFGWLKSQS